MRILNVFSPIGIRGLAIISIALIVIVSFGLFFYIQGITEQSIRDNLFEQQRKRQMDSTQIISNHIGSDLELVIAMMDGLANSLYLQQGQFYDNEAKELIGKKYDDFNKVINRLFVLDENDIVAASFAPRGLENLAGKDLSLREWVRETRNSLHPVFSAGYENQGIYRVFITYPVIQKGTEQYLGMIGLSVPTIPFFAQYNKNLETQNSSVNNQFLVAFDRRGIILANDVDQKLVGHDFFGDNVQMFINHNTELNRLTKSLLSGDAGYAVYDYGRGERLTTQQPVFVNGKPELFIQMVSPTTQLYSEIQEAISLEQVKMFSLLVGTIAAITVFVIFLVKWNSTLENEAKKKAQQLYESERKARELENSYDAVKQYLDEVLDELHRKPVHSQGY
jgi:hypothetical protein